ncbi:uncharacterized protein BXZ73DRAFT_107694 [Epithele typhae]|uniref:uncharacterized protein n=1 Tax=Epithele typhae TaxID=378194 RepID=UPI002007338D|nr:uncharacterized protein BXZ73DRAFT_107694 [Epithele typhae]KAH9912067.1 hypothetical protein BXZ73DRAFT_107694 [Epithele typhae]
MKEATTARENGTFKDDTPVGKAAASPMLKEAKRKSLPEESDDEGDGEAASLLPQTQTREQEDSEGGSPHVAKRLGTELSISVTEVLALDLLDDHRFPASLADDLGGDVVLRAGESNERTERGEAVRVDERTRARAEYGKAEEDPALRELHPSQLHYAALADRLCQGFTPRSDLGAFVIQQTSDTLASAEDTPSSVTLPANTSLDKVCVLLKEILDEFKKRPKRQKRDWNGTEHTRDSWGAQTRIEPSLAAGDKELPDIHDNVKYVPHFTRSHSDMLNVLNKTVEKYSDELVDQWNKEIDGLLTFDGLFSAALTAFNTIAFAMLQPQSSDQTNAILTQVSAQLKALRSIPLRQLTALAFQDISHFSLSSATIGIMVKQWLKEYNTGLYGFSAPITRRRIYRLSNLKRRTSLHHLAVPLF